MILRYILSLKVSKLIHKFYFLALKTKKKHKLFVRVRRKYTCVSLQPMVNFNGGDVPQMVNHCTVFSDTYYVFLVFKAKK